MLEGSDDVNEHQHIPCRVWGELAEIVSFSGRKQGQDWYVIDYLVGEPRVRYRVEPAEAIEDR